MMTPDYSQLAESALSMPESDRADLAALLLRSLDEDLPLGQHKTPEEWAAEIQRRSDEVQNGTAELVDAKEALAQMRNAIRQRTEQPSGPQ